MKTKLFFLFVFCLLSTHVFVYGNGEPSVKKRIALKGDIRTVKRSIISPDEIVTATYNEHQLELHFHQPVGSVCITVWSSGNLLIEDEHVITDNVEVPVLIPLDGFQEGDSSIEIRLENGLLYGVF